MTNFRLVAAVALVMFWPAVLSAGHGTEDDVVTVTAEQVKVFLDAREKIILVDLRPVQDFQKTRLPGARSLPMKELDKRFHEIPKSGRVVLYCDCSQNQIIEQAYQLLKDYGYRNTAVMADAFHEWVSRKYPVETGAKK
ncbi:MAG: rhodanese-like domain-containing protein [Deltaproteobacteria bacterium]|nr:MAG: rhodanese-like domain-containing protein [Deltaproteobacteria bacterium]